MNRFCYRPINTFTGSLVCLLILLFVTVLSPERMNAQSPRLEVSEDLSESRDMQGCFLAAANAARLEDLDGFLIHFTADAQKKLRRRTAMLFVQHEFTLEVLDCHVIDCSNPKGALAVKYRAGPLGQSVDVVAILTMNYENGYWKIRHEKVEIVQPSTPTCSPSRSSYLGGTDIAMR